MQRDWRGIFSSCINSTSSITCCILSGFVIALLHPIFLCGQSFAIEKHILWLISCIQSCRGFGIGISPQLIRHLRHACHRDIEMSFADHLRQRLRRRTFLNALWRAWVTPIQTSRRWTVASHQLLSREAALQPGSLCHVLMFYTCCVMPFAGGEGSEGLTLTDIFFISVESVMLWSRICQGCNDMPKSLCHLVCWARKSILGFQKKTRQHQAKTTIKR